MQTLCCLLSEGWTHCGMYLFDCLALWDLRASNHLVWRADLNEGELRVLCNLRCQGCLSTVWRTWRCVLRAEERVQFTARPCVFVFVCVWKTWFFFTWIISNACLWVCPKINRQLTVWLTIQEATLGSTCCFVFFTCVHARDVAVNWNTLFVSAIARWNNSMYLNILNLNVTVICTDLTALQHELNWKLYQYWLNNEDHQN